MQDVITENLLTPLLIIGELYQGNRTRKTKFHNLTSPKANKEQQTPFNLRFY